MTVEEYNRKADELNKQMSAARSLKRIRDLKRAMSKLERKYKTERRLSESNASS